MSPYFLNRSRKTDTTNEAIDGGKESRVSSKKIAGRSLEENGGRQSDAMNPEIQESLHQEDTFNQIGDRIL